MSIISKSITKFRKDKFDKNIAASTFALTILTSKGSNSLKINKQQLTFADRKNTNFV